MTKSKANTSIKLITNCLISDLDKTFSYVENGWLEQDSYRANISLVWQSQKNPYFDNDVYSKQKPFNRTNQRFNLYRNDQ